MTGPMLATMLLEAGYNLYSQYQGLLFHFRYVIGNLGSRPTTRGLPRMWQSYRTDDFSPLEFSWSWGGCSQSPKVRYSVEAIGLGAGGADDPFNSKAARNLVRELSSTLNDVDYQWFDHFQEALHSSYGQGAADSMAELQSDPTSVGLGFELENDRIATKAYFAPAKGRQLEQSPWTLISESIRSLENEDVRSSSYDKLVEFMDRDPEGALLEVVGLKLYVRSPHTSFDSVCAILTMGGSLHKLRSENTMNAFRELWQLVLGLEEDFPSSKELPDNGHPTSGLLYYFDIGVGKPISEPKLYIPVKHYGSNDRDIAHGLASFLKRRGQDQPFANYMRVLEHVCTHRSLEDGRGIQTYIACAVHNDGLAITSYLAPEVYHRQRWSL